MAIEVLKTAAAAYQGRSSDAAKPVKAADSAKPKKTASEADRAAAQAAGIDVTIAIAEGKNHAYGQDYYMEQYLEWIKEIFGKVS